MNVVILLLSLLGILFLTLVFIFIIFLKAFLPFIFGGAIYVPSKEEKIKKRIELAEIKPGQKAVDLGSGDGRLVVALAKAGAKAYGFEINPALVLKSKRNIRKAKLENKAFVKWGSFWPADLSEFDIVVIYGMKHVMKRLEKKLKKELKKDAKVLANVFEFPTWLPAKKSQGLYLYIQK